MKTFILTLALVITAMPSNVMSQSDSVLVTGYAEMGDVYGMRVTLIYPPCENCFDHIIPVADSESDGRIYVRFHIPTKSGTEVRIYVEEIIPDNVFQVPYDIDLDLAKFEEFRGIKANVPSNHIIDLGNIVNFYRFETVELELGAPYKGDSGKSRLKKSPPLLTVKYKNEIIEKETAIDERFVDPMTGNLRLALPKGEWTVELKTQGRVSVYLITVDPSKGRKVSKCPTEK